jgi:hypothetical protein
MAKAAGPPKKQKAKPKLTDKEQSERFKETARKLGAVDDGAFERAFSKIAPHRHVKQNRD